MSIYSTPNHPTNKNKSYPDFSKRVQFSRWIESSRFALTEWKIEREHGAFIDHINRFNSIYLCNPVRRLSFLFFFSPQFFYFFFFLLASILFHPCYTSPHSRIRSLCRPFNRFVSMLDFLRVSASKSRISP